MAQASVRKPVCTTEEVKEIIKVELLIDSLSGSKMKAKNGEVKVTFSNYGIFMDATVKSNSSQIKWHFQVKRLPSEIITEKSSWKIEPGRVVIRLHKKENVSWVPLLRKGLEQASSEGSDEENTD